MSKLLKLEGEREIVKDNEDDRANVREDVSQDEVVTAARLAGLGCQAGGTTITGSASDGSAGAQESNEACSSSLRILSAREEALQTPVILRHLFQLSPASVVAPARLVCKLWHDESLAAWRVGFPLIIFKEQEDIFVAHHRNRSRRRPSHLRTPLKEFLEFTDKPENQCNKLPHRSIVLDRCKYNLNSHEFKVFWNALGSNLTYLHLYWCAFSNAEEFRQVIYKCCPLLQKLEIAYCDIRVSPYSGGEEEENGLECKDPPYGIHKHLKSLDVQKTMYFPISWIELFSHFPALTSLTVLYDDNATAEFETLCHAIKSLRQKDIKKLPLKRFQLDPPLVISRDSASHYKFALLKELRLPLTNCCITVHQKLNQRFLRSALDYLAPSVNTIELVGEYDKEFLRLKQVGIPTWFRGFPFGIHLNNLTILESEIDLRESFKLLKYAPNLSVLAICEDQPPQGIRIFTSATEGVSKTCKEELANVQMLRLETFRLGLHGSNDDILHLLNWMPRIRNLEMNLNDVQFGMVCQKWKNLRTLAVYGTRMTTEGITGMIKGKTTKEAGIRPNIANLERLESLIISFHLPPEAVYHLFLHLPCLQYLTCSSDFAKIVRKDLDITSYQRAIQDNVVERWIADNGNTYRSLQDLLG